MDKLLSRSAAFEQQMINMLMHQPYDDSDRIRVSQVMCSVSFEHAESFKMLLASRNFTSAIGMLRLQFESLVRGVWVLYAASEIELSKLTAELNNERAPRKTSTRPLLVDLVKLRCLETHSSPADETT